MTSATPLIFITIAALTQGKGRGLGAGSHTVSNLWHGRAIIHFNLLVVGKRIRIEVVDDLGGLWRPQLSF